MQRLFITLCLAVGMPASAGLFNNGKPLNGKPLNGQSLNGKPLNGQALSVVSVTNVNLDAVWFDGVSMAGVRARVALDKTGFRGTVADLNSTCGHSQLVTGVPLSNCSPCARVVSHRDSYCGTNAWDALCVNEASSWCSFNSNTDTKLLGAVFEGSTYQGTPVRLRLDAVQPAPLQSTPQNGDVRLHTFSYLEQPGYFKWTSWGVRWVPDTWSPLCSSTDADGLFNKAVATQGQWADCAGAPGCGGRFTDEGITLGCRDYGATAKCLERVGFKWWNGYAHEQAHQACVRMLRADYCGDGVTHTLDGTRLDVRDFGVGVQSYSGTPWKFEAEWSATGARCVAAPRYDGADPNSATGYFTVGDYIAARCPGMILPPALYDAKGGSPNTCGTFYRPPGGPLLPVLLGNASESIP